MSVYPAHLGPGSLLFFHGDWTRQFYLYKLLLIVISMVLSDGTNGPEECFQVLKLIRTENIPDRYNTVKGY